MSRLTHASLFSGIGGAEIAAERAGWQNLFHCEINPFCRRVLEYHYPNSKSYDNITETDFTPWRGKVTVLTGGFPCQPFSLAGRRKGADDDRYLWPQMLRAIREIQPAWVVGENVNGIRSMVQSREETEMASGGMLFRENHLIRARERFTFEEVCGSLEREGYSVQAFVIPACAVGAPHRRDRVWFVANNRCRQRTDKPFPVPERDTASDIGQGCENRTPANPDEHGDKPRQASEGTEGNRDYRLSQQGERREPSEWADGLPEVSRPPADTYRNGGQAEAQRLGERPQDDDEPQSVLDCGTTSYTSSLGRLEVGNENGDACESQGERRPCPTGSPQDWWREFPTQPPVCGGDDGIPGRLDGITFPRWRMESIKAYGNAWVPQVAYEIFRAINMEENKGITS